MIPLFWMASTSVKPSYQAQGSNRLDSARDHLAKLHSGLSESAVCHLSDEQHGLSSIMGITGNLLGSSLAAYGFACFRFPGERSFSS